MTLLALWQQWMLIAMAVVLCQSLLASGHSETPKHRYLLFLDGYYSPEQLSLLERQLPPGIHCRTPSPHWPSDFLPVTSEHPLEYGDSLVSKIPSLRAILPDRPLSALETQTASDGSPNVAKPSSFAHPNINIPKLLGADQLWAENVRGQRVKMAVFDTGLRSDMPQFANLRDRTNWTPDPDIDDWNGHGTFVTSIIAAQNSPECPGIAPEVELYIFRVFTTDGATFTSSFLNAFNYAIHKRVDILNLSIGGVDFRDEPFVDKVRELSAHGILVVAGIGNSGPGFGTLKNPGDQLDVLGVGAVDYHQQLAPFSSRGMSLHELHTPGSTASGYGRPKPDILTYGVNIPGLQPDGTCSLMNGTSLAAPILSGALALILNAMEEQGRRHLVNPASIRQAMLATAVRLSEKSIFEQGAGVFQFQKTLRYLETYKPQVTVHPIRLDLTECPYFWPYCDQPLYYSGMPVIVNVTILNGVDVVGKVLSVNWVPADTKNGNLLRVEFEYSRTVWPWSGYLAAILSVEKTGETFTGIAEGEIHLSISSALKEFNVMIPVRASVMPTPQRANRILWDQYHSIAYPVEYFPRDSLNHTIPQDVHGDHLHTNFVDLYKHLRKLGYFLEILAEPWTCFDASLYGTLVVADPEDDFGIDERYKLMKDIQEHKLNLLILGEWYHPSLLERVRYYDESFSLWEPAMGGSNLMALNSLLSPYGVELGTGTYSGEIAFPARNSDENVVHYRAGTSIVKFPRGGHVVRASSMFDDLTFSPEDTRENRKNVTDVAVLGFLATQPDGGRIAIFGDTACADSSQKWVRDFSPPQKAQSDATYPMCLWLMEDLVAFTSQGVVSASLKSAAQHLSISHYLFPGYKEETVPRYPRDDAKFTSVSRTRARATRLQSNSRDSSALQCKYVSNDLETARAYWEEGTRFLQDSVVEWGYVQVPGSAEVHDRWYRFSGLEPLSKIEKVSFFSWNRLVICLAAGLLLRFAWIHSRTQRSQRKLGKHF